MVSRNLLVAGSLALACGGPQLVAKARESGAGLSGKERPTVSTRLEGRTFILAIEDYQRGCGPLPEFDIAADGAGWVIQEKTPDGPVEASICRFAVDIRILGLPVGDHALSLRNDEGREMARTTAIVR